MRAAHVGVVWRCACHPAFRETAPSCCAGVQCQRLTGGDLQAPHNTHASPFCCLSLQAEQARNEELVDSVWPLAAKIKALEAQLAGGGSAGAG